MPGYLNILLLSAPFLFLVIGVSFRLMDNSASVFLDHDILISSSYVSTKSIKKLIKFSENQTLEAILRRILTLRKLHNVSMALALITLPIAVTWLYVQFY